MIDVNPNHLETVKSILAAHVPECEVRAFGSRVNWTAKDYSDLDLAIVSDGALDPDVLRSIREAFEESDLLFRVDVLDWHAISAEFQKVIEKKYEVILTSRKGLSGGSVAPFEHNRGWPVVSLGEIATKIGSGATPRGGSDAYLQSRTHFALVRSQNVFDRRFDRDGLAFISDEQAEALRGVTLLSGDILLNITGDGVTFARACIVPADVLPACVNQHVAIIRLDPSLADPGYVLAFLTHTDVKSYIESFNAGGSRRAITKGHIQSFRLPLPPLPEQRAISHILGTLDAKIELNRRMNETLEAIARALFKSWFVDFDPVRAKAEHRDPGLPPAVADLFPDSFEDSAPGQIPKGWDIGPFLRTARLLSGGTPKTDRPEYWDGGIRWASAKDVSQCSDAFLVVTERTITKQGLDESATQLVPALSSVVVARGATTGRMAMLGDVMAMNQTCYALKSMVGAPFTLYCHLRHEMDKLVHGAHGSVFDTITTSTFATSEVVLPTNSALRAFEHSVSPLFRRILAGTEESLTLAALRDTLLPRLISGELRFKHANLYAGSATK